MALSAQTYDAAYASFRRRLPERFNIAESARRFGVEALSALVDRADRREDMAAFVETRAPSVAPQDET